MNKFKISSAQYMAHHLTGNNCAVLVTINGTEMSVPLDPANRHYAEIMRQVEEGKLTIEEAE